MAVNLDRFRGTPGPLVPVRIASAGVKDRPRFARRDRPPAKNPRRVVNSRPIGWLQICVLDKSRRRYVDTTTQAVGAGTPRLRATSSR
jgi:hypothetical protein